MKHILITGGAGYIGSHVVRQLSKSRDMKVTIVDNLCGGTFDSIAILRRLYKVDNFNFIKLNLSDFYALEEIFKNNRFDAIIHFAAHLQVGESVINPLKYYMNNSINTTNLISMAIKYDVNRFIFSSTAAVYGEPTAMYPLTEDMILEPINPYGSSKLMSENILQDTANAHKDFKYVILRYFNVAGASEDNTLGEAHEPETHLIPLVVQTALGERDKIMIFGDDYNTPDGSCIRDYVHVEDLASAHIQALSYLEETNKSNIFNCGYGVGYSVKEVVESIKEISNFDFKVEVVPRRVGDPAILVSDNTKIKTIMGWTPKYNNLKLICQSAMLWEKNYKSL